tara:strand:- start:6790 stop:6927 length:138 start_codon:yes stop_codon:yes gene_type:complete
MNRCKECNKIKLPTTKKQSIIIKNALLRLQKDCNFGVRPITKERE